MPDRPFQQTDKKGPQKTRFLKLINELLKSGRVLTYEIISKEYESRYPELTQNDRRRALQDKSYSESMRKAVSEISNIMKAKNLHLICGGNNRSGYHYAYPKEYEGIDEWLAAKDKDEKRMRQQQLLRLIAASKGLLPKEWMVDLTAKVETLMALEGRERRTLIEFDNNDQLKNIGLIPVFYDAIEKHRVLLLVNKAAYQYERTIQFTPYFLKEYNRRWFCIGHCVESNGTERPDYTCALDRVMQVSECENAEWIPPVRDYSNYFDDIVGMRHEKDPETGLPNPVEHIVIETLDPYTHGRIASKPLHRRQVEEMPFNSDGNGKGRVSIDVVPNPELISIILSFGKDIRVLEPASFVHRIKNTVREMAVLYENQLAISEMNLMRTRRISSSEKSEANSS